MKIILLIVIVVVLGIILRRIWVVKRFRRTTVNYAPSRCHDNDEYENERIEAELLYGDEHYACGDRD